MAIKAANDKSMSNITALPSGVNAKSMILLSTRLHLDHLHYLLLLELIVPMMNMYLDFMILIQLPMLKV